MTEPKEPASDETEPIATPVEGDDASTGEAPGAAGEAPDAAAAVDDDAARAEADAGRWPPTSSAARTSRS